MTRHTGALAAAVVTAAIALTGCAAKADQPADPTATAGPQAPAIVIPYDELLNQKTVTRAITLHVGDTLQVSLGSNPSTGFQWAPQMQISDGKVLVQSGHEPIGPTDSRPGAPGSEVWALQALAPGTTTASTTYSRPWEGGEKDTWTFTATVTVN